MRPLVQGTGLLGLDVYFPSHDEGAGEQLIPQHDGETEFTEVLGDEGGGAKFTPGGFGVTMKVAAPVAQGILSHGGSCVANPAAIVTGRGQSKSRREMRQGSGLPLKDGMDVDEVVLCAQIALNDGLASSFARSVKNPCCSLFLNRPSGAEVADG
jgi:hypothetical protein